jgi:hypothetical protein
MNDLRVPTGALFSILGLVLLIYFMLHSNARAPLSGANVNLWCGLVFLGFGGILLWLSHRAS